MHYDDQTVVIAALKSEITDLKSKLAMQDKTSAILDRKTEKLINERGKLQIEREKLQLERNKKKPYEELQDENEQFRKIIRTLHPLVEVQQKFNKKDLENYKIVRKNHGNKPIPFRENEEAFFRYERDNQKWVQQQLKKYKFI